MKKSIGAGSKMSNYQYGSKKTVWKWTAGKILAFSAFGVVVAGLIYTETRSNITANPEIISSSDGNFQSASTTIDFDQEYQEFLKKGKRVVPQYNSDSSTLSVQTSTQSVEAAQTPSANKRNVSASQQSRVDQSKPNRVPSLNTKNSNQASVENNIEPVPLTSSNNKNRNIGTLEEIDPLDQSSRSGNLVSDQNPSTSEEVIVEEFYTEDIVTGTISAMSDRTPLSGVEVTVKGTDIKSVTGSNGKYSIKVPGDPLYRTVRYSYQGNSTERDVVPGTEILNIRF